MTIQNRYDFVLYFDVKNGNPNGDPDANNMPRSIDSTGHGLVTDACIKRKIRNYVEKAREGIPGYEIYVREGAVLNEQHKRAYDSLGIKPEKKKLTAEADVTRFMADTFFDIRTFGAVMSTEINCGKLRGPVQIGMSESTHPIQPMQITVTRCAVTHEKDKESGSTFGEKYIVPYALYRLEGTIEPFTARKSGFSEEDLALLWEAMIRMFDGDRSASRGRMATRKLYVFKHESALGNAPAAELCALVRAETQDNQPPVDYTDCSITCQKERMPNGVALLELL